MFGKRIISFCVILAILILCECSRNGSTKNTIKVFAPSWFLVESDPGVAQSLSIFKREFPDASVEFVVASGRWEDILQKLVLMCASGDVPDIVWFKPEWGEIIFERCILPLDNVDLSVYFPELAGMAIYNGKVYGIPFEVGVRVLWLRSDVFKLGGADLSIDAWTLSEFLRVLSELGKCSNREAFKYTFAFPASDDIKTAYQALALIVSFGGDLKDLRSERTESAVRELFKFYKTLIERGLTPKEIYQSSQGLVYSGMKQKWYASVLGGSWEKRGYKEAGLNVVPVFPPAIGNAKSPATYADIWAVGLSPTGASKRAARRFVGILTSEEVQRARVENGLLSPRRDVYDPQSRWLLLLEHSHTLRISDESLKFLESLARAIHLVAKCDWTEDEATRYVFEKEVVRR